MSSDITSRVEQMNELFSEASALKDSTRVSPTNNDANVEASRRYEQAADIARELLSTADIPDDLRRHLDIYAPYYSYESKVTLRAWHYERHEITEATEYQKAASLLLAEHVRQIEAALATANAEESARLNATLDKASFFRGMDKVATSAIRARAAWDKDDFISALDEYRTAIPLLARLVEESQNLKVPAYYRVTLGNYLGMVANCSGALAKHIAHTHGLPGVVPHEIACDLVRYTLDAYRAGMAACDANPEWTQYRGLAQLCRSNVETLLEDNKAGWPEIYADLHDDPDLLKIMGRIDLTTLKAIGRGIMSHHNKLRILFLAANPLDSAPLRLDAELRNIREKIDLSKAREEVELCQEWAVRVTDLQRALLKNAPAIVHFSGHGSDTGEIVLEDASGDSHAVPANALASLFKTFRDSVKCVVLNSCGSESQSDGIVEHIDVVITMSDEVDDDAANAFASAFYQALAWGQSVQKAFDLGCNQMALEGFADADVPVLKAGTDIDADALYLVGTLSGSKSKGAEAKAKELCQSACNRWSRFDHVAFTVDEGGKVLASTSEQLFEFAEGESELSSDLSDEMCAVASEMKTLSEKRVKKASVYNMKLGSVDDEEEKEFKADGDVVFAQLAQLARRLSK